MVPANPPRSNSRYQGLQADGIGGCGALLVVVEIDEYVAALLLPGLDMPGPIRKRIGAIVPFVTAARPMTSDIDEIGGALPGCRRIVMIRNAERDVLFCEQAQDARGIPAGMPEFETVAALFDSNLKKEISRSASASKFGGS
jgi:hypothetical protein